MMNNFIIPPAFIMMLGALLLPLFPIRLRGYIFLFFPLLALVSVVTIPFDLILTTNIAGYDLVLVEGDKLSRIFGIIFSLIAIIGGIYSLHNKNLGEQIAALIYAGGALGVTFSGDYLTLFFFWESMAIASTYLVWARKSGESMKAGMRYLLMHMFGGALLLTGIILNIAETGSILIEALIPEGRAASILILLGVALNVGLPPLHAWLPDAYPKATVTGAVFLSAFTTKTAVFVLLKIFPGWEILIVWGVAMALYGVVYAVLANDIREILAYHIISQVGYMVAGAGIGTELAINGAAAHAFSHILYKALLFMGAGVVLHTTGRSKLTELGGISKKMPVTLWLYMIGAFSISGFPLFNGFISKSIIIEAAGRYHMENIALLLILASIGTFLHTGLKLPYFTWFGKENDNINPTKPPVNMHIGMGLAAFFCTLFGVAPSLLYSFLPFPIDYQPYTLYHLMESTQILVFTFLAFWFLRGKLAGENYIPLDADWFYRKPKRFYRMIFVDSIEYIFNKAEEMTLTIASAVSEIGKNPTVFYQREEKFYDPDKHRPTSQMLLILIIFSFVVFSLLSLFILV
jgi:multicomponent Na+:H+ antiporter subunit D